MLLTGLLSLLHPFGGREPELEDDLCQVLTDRCHLPENLGFTYVKTGTMIIHVSKEMFQRLG